MPAQERSPARQVVAVGGGLLFIASLLYFAWQYWLGFDAPPEPGLSTVAATVWNTLFFTAFALHHSVFARAGLKSRLSRALPPEMERSFYVWLASALFVAVCAAWRPIPGQVWAPGGWAALALRSIQLGGAALTLVAARHLDMLELAGVRQTLGLPRRRDTGLDDHGPYGLVRHPIYFAWLLLVWAAPVMNATRFVFALVSTVYLLVAIPYEERDLRRTFGQAYDAYAKRVKRKLIPGLY